jgi:hypothetical protein
MKNDAKLAEKNKVIPPEVKKEQNEASKKQVITDFLKLVNKDKIEKKTQ